MCRLGSLSIRECVCMCGRSHASTGIPAAAAAGDPSVPLPPPPAGWPTPSARISNIHPLWGGAARRRGSASLRDSFPRQTRRSAGFADTRGRSSKSSEPGDWARTQRRRCTWFFWSGDLCSSAAAPLRIKSVLRCKFAKVMGESEVAMVENTCLCCLSFF